MDVVWGVMYMMAALLTGTGYIIYYIMRTAYIEMRDDGTESRNEDSNLGSESGSHAESCEGAYA